MRLGKAEGSRFPVRNIVLSKTRTAIVLRWTCQKYPDYLIQPSMSKEGQNVRSCETDINEQTDKCKGARLGSGRTEHKQVHGMVRMEVRIHLSELSRYLTLNGTELCHLTNSSASISRLIEFPYGCM